MVKETIRDIVPERHPGPEIEASHARLLDACRQVLGYYDSESVEPAHIQTRKLLDMIGHVRHAVAAAPPESPSP